MNSQELVITVHDMQLAAIAWGDKMAPPLLALHGWLDNAASFSLLAPLIKHHYVVAVDLPGHGLSDHLPPGYHYHFVDSVEYILAVADVLGWQQFSMLGHSMGAAIGVLTAGTIPERIKQFVALDTLGPYTTPEALIPKQLRDYLTQFESVVGKAPKYYSDFAQAVTARQKNSDLTSAAAEVLAHRGVLMTQQGFCWRHDVRLLLRPPSYLTENQVKAFITHITAPICLIHSSAFYQLHQHRCAWADDIDIHQVTGGHHAHLVNPQVVANVVNRWLTKGE
ncbi:MAG: alpha/beta fold hydrolase [Legionellales bacterium]|nr:alpha/beta fold hydrolase [Legionellales bacterium]